MGEAQKMVQLVLVNYVNRHGEKNHSFILKIMEGTVKSYDCCFCCKNTKGFMLKITSRS